MDWIVYLGYAAGVVLWIAAIWALARVVAWVCRPRAKTPAAPVKKTFLEEALDADPVQRVVPGYSWDDLQRDLHDPRLSFEEISEKCGGNFPTKPTDVPPGPKGADAEQSPGNVTDRNAQLAEWFKTVSGKVGVLKVVEPPPPPAPVIQLKGSTVSCPNCHGSGKSIPGYQSGFSSSPMRVSHGPLGAPGASGLLGAAGVPGGQCGHCKGHGFVVITHG